MTKIKQQKNNFQNIPDKLSGLVDLAENLWWCWNPQARMLFKLLDRRTWKESGHNPDQLLKRLPKETFGQAARDSNFLRHYDLIMSQFQKYLRAKPTNVLPFPIQESPNPIAYFSAEYGLHHSLPFYAGGLGFLSGDHLKECSDLGIPLVGIGFMYPAGYLRQVINNNGWQENLTQEVDQEAASINRVLDDQGDQLIIKVPGINIQVYVAVWKVTVGKVDLYLLDTEVDQNEPWMRNVSNRLYTSDLEQRLLQEIILGIGGSEVLKTLGIDYSMLHLNEGHASFALLEGLRHFIDKGMKVDRAKQELAKISLFTTHTPVPAGHDIFPFELIDKYFQSYPPKLGLSREEFFDLGRHPQNPDSGFNMAALALRLTGHSNAVSQRHGQVSRKMWHCLWPDKKEQEVPIDSITNGVHLPTWLEPKMRLLFDRYFGSGWIEEHDNPVIWEFIEEIPDRDLWQVHYWLKMKLINYIRLIARQRWTKDRIDPSQVVASGSFLEPSILTIGFARRFATYKRGDLLFNDLDRLKRLLQGPWRPVQFIFAGKAHPADEQGKLIIQRIYNWARDPEFSGRIAFVENYNEQLAQYMVHGVDVWLNTPQPPLEASGTSGMKATMNGVPNLSIPDGWWLEGYQGNNGWSFGNKEEEVRERDKNDARDLYQLIEEQIVPLYYEVDEDGTPIGWVRLMKEAIKSNAPRFSARRMVKEYLEKYYKKALARQY